MRECCDGQVARLGGDEFAVWIPGMSATGEAQAVAASARALLTAPIDIEGYRLEIGASVGVAVAPTHALDRQRVAALRRRRDVRGQAERLGQPGLRRLAGPVLDRASRPALGAGGRRAPRRAAGPLPAARAARGRARARLRGAGALAAPAPGAPSARALRAARRALRRRAAAHVLGAGRGPAPAAGVARRRPRRAHRGEPLRAAPHGRGARLAHRGPAGRARGGSGGARARDHGKRDHRRSRAGGRDPRGASATWACTCRSTISAPGSRRSCT